MELALIVQGMKMWWLYDSDDYEYQVSDPFYCILILYTYVSQPQPSLPISYDLMLYFFMQSWQMLSPDGILASQKVHAAVTGLLLVLDATANNTGYTENSY